MSVEAEPRTQIGMLGQALCDYRQATEQFRLKRESLGVELTGMVGRAVNINGFPSEVHFAHGCAADGTLKFCWKPMQGERLTLVTHEILTFDAVKGLLVAARDRGSFNASRVDNQLPYAYLFPLDGIVDLAESLPAAQTE